MGRSAANRTQESRNLALFGDASTDAGRRAFRWAAAIFVALTAYDMISDWSIDHFFARIPSHVSWETVNDIITAAFLGTALFLLVNRGVVAILREFERVRAFFELGSDAIFVTDAETGAFTDVNEAACAMFGYSPEEVRGLNIGAVSSGVAPYTQQDGMSRIQEGQTRTNDIFRWHCKAKDGRLFWAEISTRVVQVGGRMVSIAILRDITARIAAEQEAVENQRLINALFHNADTAIFDTDLSGLFNFVQALKRQGVPNFRDYIMEDERRLFGLAALTRQNAANGAAVRMMGVTDKWTERQAVAIQQGNARLILDIGEAIFNGETSLKAETELMTASGEPVAVLNSLLVPATEQEAKRVPCLVFDLRQFKIAEGERHANAAKSQFLTSMSHEIRTPLNGVIGNLELLGLASPTPEQVELIEQADKAAKALLALIGNILDFSKIEQGKLAIEMGEVSPGALVEEATAVLQTKARQKSIFITTILDHDLPEVVWSDGARLRQILLNLIGNAVKFTDVGSVAVRAAVDHWDGARCQLKFTVNDSGRGFDQTRAALLFEPFVQDKVAVDTTEGTGLGLSICAKLAEAMGGAIGCEGVSGEGATFWFTVPVQVVKKNVHVRPADLRTCKVVIVGANNPWVQPLRSYFTMRGASVLQASDPDSAVAALMSDANRDSAALLIPATEAAPPAVHSLRSKNIVPIIYGGDGTYHSKRIALRAGFACVISTAEGPGALDRNIGTLLGQVPKQEPVSAKSPGTPMPVSTLSGKRVLVLEDRLVNRLVIQKQLARLQVQFTMANDGLQGLAAMESQEFDLILCDCSMPNMNGYEFTRTLRAREKFANPERHLPIIALTANAFREDVEKCLQAGMDDFVSKPVTLERLSEALAKWLAPAQQMPADGFSHEVTDGAMPIDLGALQGLIGTDEHEIIAEILSEFAQAAGKSFSAFESALAGGRLNGLHVIAHGAKGEARSAGANRLGELYAELERQTKAGDYSGIEQKARNLATEIQRIEQFVRERAGVSSHPSK